EAARDLRSTIDELWTLPIKGFTPRVLLAEEKLNIAREHYLSVLIDKTVAEIKLLAHTHGGIEVEENDQSSFLSLTLDPAQTEAIGETLAEYLDLPEQSFALQDLIENLARCFVKNDALLLEI